MRDADKNIESGKQKNQSASLSSMLKKANLLAERGLYEEAIASIQRAMAIYPNEAECSVQLANIYRAQNRVEPAIEAMQRALDLDPKNGTVQQQLLKTLLELGRYDEVIKTAKKLLKKSPRNILLHDTLGVAYLQRGELDKALKVTRDLIRISPTDPAHHFKKGVLLQQKGDAGEAMTAYIRALELDPNGDISDDIKQAISSLDAHQLQQILTIAVGDSVFRAKLMLDPETTLRERGFRLSPSGISALKQIDLIELAGDMQHRYYH